jgi:hypothetical protein
MKDWAGNEIKNGQTIVWVQITPPLITEMFTINPDGSREIIHLFDDLEKFWIPGNDRYVVEEDGKLFSIFQIDEGEIKSPLETVNKFYREILCIKGISDSKEMYYNQSKIL